MYKFGLIIFVYLISCNSFAISITGESDPNLLRDAILGDTTGITVTSSSLLNQSNGSRISSGVYTNGSNTYGIGDGIVISSGNVNNYNDGPNTSNSTSFGYGVAANAQQETLLDPISGGSFNHNDVTQFDLTFDVDATTDRIFFNVVFGSEEYDAFVGSFIDAFGIYLNGTNIAMYDNLPVNIDHPGMSFTSGTELNGILDPTSGTGDPIMLFEGEVTPGSTDNLLTFILADTLDSSFDSVAFISGFGATDPGGGTPGGGLPGTSGGGGSSGGGSTGGGSSGGGSTGGDGGMPPAAQIVEPPMYMLLIIGLILLVSQSWSRRVPLTH